MYFYTVFSLGLASMALAAPANLQARNAADVVTALGMVTKSVMGLDKAVKSLNSSTDATALSNIATQSTMVGTTVKMAQTMIQNTGPISIFSTMQVMESANGLTQSLITTTIDLLKKKPIINQAGLSQVVGTMLMMQKNQSSSLSLAVTDKVPALAKPIAVLSSERVTDLLDSAIKAFMTNGTAASPFPAVGNLTLPALLPALRPLPIFE